MFHLTGGIAIDMDNDWLQASASDRDFRTSIFYQRATKIPFVQESVRFYFNLLKELSTEYSGNRRVVITAGNLGHSDGSERDEKGVASFHAYSVLQVVQVINYKVSLIIA